MVGSSLMQVPNPTRWTAGMLHDEVLFNEVSDALTFLLNPPEAEVHQTVVQSIPNGTTTATPITLDTVTTDNDGMFSAGQPTRLTINTPGWYECFYAVHWASKADNTIRSMGIALNGVLAIGSLIGYYDHVNDSGTTPEVWVTYDAYFKVGDYVQLGVLQGSGAALSTASDGTNATNQTFLRVRWSSL